MLIRKLLQLGNTGVVSSIVDPGDNYVFLGLKRTSNDIEQCGMGIIMILDEN